MEKDIVLKAWEVFQGLAQGLGDSCWKIRSVFYTASSALIAYAFVHSVPSLYAVAMGLSLAFFILEGGYKQVQDQYISKSLAIERTLNDILVEKPEPFIPESGISTSITTPTIRACFTKLRYRNFFFWIPYGVVFLVSLILWWVGVVAQEPTPKVALVTDTSLDEKQGNRTVHSVPLLQWQQEWVRIADSLGGIDTKLGKERPLTVQLQVPTPGVSTPSPTPEPSHTPARRGRRR